jgi:hypothetical protein
MLIENGISAAVQFFHLDALTRMVGLKIDFDLQICKGRNRPPAYRQLIEQYRVASIRGWSSGPPEARHSWAAAMS